MTRLEAPHRCLLCGGPPFQNWLAAARHVRAWHPEFCENHDVAEALVPDYDVLRADIDHLSSAGSPFHCRHCAATMLTVEGMTQHVNGEHEVIVPEYERDFISAVQWRQENEARLVENEQLVERFERQLATVGTVADFLTDCGARDA